MYFLIGVVIFVIFVTFCYLYIRRKLKEMFGSINLGQIIKQEKILENETPKSVGSMDRIYLKTLQKDFPDININELKKMAEDVIISYFKGIERKESMSVKSEQIKLLVDEKIQELGNSNESYSNIRFHNTVLSKYEKNNGVATIYIAVSLQYLYRKNNDNDYIVQDRFRVEFVYITDVSEISANQKIIGLNCPNCGSPLTNEHECSYCHTKNIDIVKRVWICNNLKRY